ncbi:putative copia-type protein [Senna tora]|uniref:Putative copia-type protein n=1 Tax=Senna tora TaxID=362788 RepID=A0A834WG59_9FABA|nr:putative copia-type protein [Senna tora]
MEDEVLDGFPEEGCGGVADLGGGVGVGGGDEILDAVWEFGFLGREFDGVDVDLVSGGRVIVDGVLEGFGVGGSGDDGHVVAMCCEGTSHLAERGDVTRNEPSSESDSVSPSQRNRRDSTISPAAPPTASNPTALNDSSSSDSTTRVRQEDVPNLVSQTLSSHGSLSPSRASLTQSRDTEAGQQTTSDLARSTSAQQQQRVSQPNQGKPFVVFEGTPMQNSSLFRQAIGSLQYLVTTRPDIAYSVNKLSQFLASPTEVDHDMKITFEAWNSDFPSSRNDSIWKRRVHIYCRSRGSQPREPVPLGSINRAELKSQNQENQLPL